MTATDDQLRQRIEHLRGIHPKEIAIRAGEAISLMEELLELREALLRTAGATEPGQCAFQVVMLSAVMDDLTKFGEESGMTLDAEGNPLRAGGIYL